ncbi:hypothetical protein SARC_01508 [Sphaeroforma arctica JP610]|uniref:Cytochrome b5 heme-binding domain-containing protein n=1 Tax=Sphaeroforma arctica JP610 TaxID=667725 RepID=A0A0L0GBR4_9EUKA|nr:hypothetical protein SARC_01508 [Sphaeroforma arctica JP610]KNC86349.1 hypothetical protein SARC_01508 [Sphaeroforma arctica JP610]|eukprot:XP_014160251.1 hypothetical protein SARC_01508 [Sphaeroforma arctica JP610]
MFSHARYKHRVFYSVKALSTTKPGGTQDSSEAVGAPLKHFTAEELLQYDGTDANGAVYVAIKGVVFDVTDNRKAYEPGQGYAIFAGRDASRALGLMSLKKKDAVPNLDGLEEKQIDVLDNWVKFYQKKYMIMGTVGPNASPGRLPAIATAETKPSE